MADLTKANQARLEKSLNQRFRYHGAVYTLKEWMERHCVRVAAEKVQRHEYNRRKFNRMNYEEQAAYEKKLEETKTEHRAYVEDSGFIEIPKIVHDWWMQRDEAGKAAA